jgi:hypothetical protein
MSDLWDSVPALITVMLAAMAAAVVIYRVRRWIKESDLPPTTGFTLADLRKIYQDGKMTREEFERASQRIVAAHSAHFLPSEKTAPKTDKAGDARR